MIKVAFIGAGVISEEHLKVFSQIDDFELCGIYSRSIDKAITLSQKYKIKNVYNSIDDLYFTTKADVVIVSVSILELRNITNEIFKYEWTCLLEKPIGYNKLEFELILQNAKLHNAIVYVALNRRNYDSINLVLNEINDIDDKRIIHILDQEDIISQRLNGVNELILENYMYANSVHLIDLFLLFGRGNIIKIDNVIPWNKNLPSFLLSIISFSSGDIGIYEAVWNAPGPWSMSINTNIARFELRPLEVAHKLEYGKRIPIVLLNDNSESFKPGFMNQAVNLKKAIKGEQHNLLNIEKYTNTVNLISKIYE
jgi:hypothetical protein